MPSNAGFVVDAGAFVRYGLLQTQYGPMLLAASQQGVCHLTFDDGQADCAQEFPNALPAAAPGAGQEDYVRLAELVVEALARPGVAQTIPLDLAGTPFQRRVWQALRAIPAGETRSYAAIAAAIGQPGAVRAVGRANAANRVAVLVPCHRVVRSDGALGGYAWGEGLKRKLLEQEGALQHQKAL